MSKLHVQMYSAGDWSWSECISFPLHDISHIYSLEAIFPGNDHQLLWPFCLANELPNFTLDSALLLRAEGCLELREPMNGLAPKQLVCLSGEVSRWWRETFFNRCNLSRRNERSWLPIVNDNGLIIQTPIFPGKIPNALRRHKSLHPLYPVGVG